MTTEQIEDKLKELREEYRNPDSKRSRESLTLEAKCLKVVLRLKNGKANRA